MRQCIKMILINAILFLLSVNASQAAPLKGLTSAKDRLREIGTGIYGGTPSSLEAMIGGFIQIGLTIMGVIFLVLMVYAGYRWMIARGEEEEAKKALGTIKMSVIGMIIVVASYGVSSFLIGRLGLFGGLNGAQNMLNTTGDVIYQGGGGKLPIEVIIGGLIQAALTILGVLFLILIVYSGYRWMMARDEEEEAKKAMTTIKNSLIGLLIIIGAYAITYFVMYQLLSKTGAIVP